jgi:WXG100 family type VII secretion target
MELDGLKVVHGGLDQAADDLMAVVGRIGARLQLLEQELEPLRRAWVGDAQVAYAAAKQRWDGAVMEMRDLLQQTSQQVSRSNAAYRAADSRGARTFEI